MSAQCNRRPRAAIPECAMARARVKNTRRALFVRLNRARIRFRAIKIYAMAPAFVSMAGRPIAIRMHAVQQHAKHRALRALIVCQEAFARVMSACPLD
jgi:hypothetical protein